MNLTRIIWVFRAIIFRFLTLNRVKFLYFGRPISVIGIYNWYINKNVGIYPGSRIEVINGYLSIGKNTRIGQNFFCETSGGRVVIGENVTISANCFLGTTNYNWRKMPDIGFKASEIEGGEIVIEDNVFIGFGACILPGAHLGKGSIVGALSVVNSYVPAGTIFKTRRL